MQPNRQQTDDQEDMNKEGKEGCSARLNIAGRQIDRKMMEIGKASRRVGKREMDF